MGILEAWESLGSFQGLAATVVLLALLSIVISTKLGKGGRKWQ